MKEVVYLVIGILLSTQLALANENEYVWNGRSIKYIATPPKQDMVTVIVIHGIKRNYKTYYKRGQKLYKTHGVGIVAPLIDENNFPKSQNFQRANVARRGVPLERNEWTFGAISALVTHLQLQTEYSGSKFILFGHSAGAQFVHRMALLSDEDRISLYIAANAGTYTFLNQKWSYPYGIKGLPLDLTSTPSNELIILAGDADNDPNHKYLNRSKRAFMQGRTRFERANNFVYNAHTIIGASWPTLIVMPGVNHSSSKTVAFMSQNWNMIKDKMK